MCLKKIEIAQWFGGLSSFPGVIKSNKFLIINLGVLLLQKKLFCWLYQQNIGGWRTAQQSL